MEKGEQRKECKVRITEKGERWPMTELNFGLIKNSVVVSHIDSRLQSKTDKSTHHFTTHLQNKQFNVISTLDSKRYHSKHKNHSIKCFVDTGATISCCSVSLFKHLHINDTCIEQSNIHDCVGVGGEIHTIIGFAELPIDIGHLVFVQNFHFFKVKPAIDFSFGLCVEEQGRY
ncbi:Hypothetical predicted protein [Mytilus galloprovincialis]|uniref:Uncharacterized protein n=1 Tax=Mytilus galloprovincialis TaxID=29158 RepID=A0A8B6EWA8_MYTGA|nr:Hypothetical predicted protein [Mytilus galloprovincialis]